MSNWYKPRYKICFQTRSKIWPYKFSRLRRFYDIRGKVILRKGFWHRSSLVMKSMKWMIIRRFMVPLKRRRLYKKNNYKNTFYMKQKLKNFYGKFNERRFRTLFLYSYNKVKHSKVQAFYTALEHRLDIIAFRMKLLPTIYACHQLINHNGILVNNTIVKLPNYRLKVGDIISIPSKIWDLFYLNIYFKIADRIHRNFLFKNRWKNRYIKLKNLYKKKWFFYKHQNYRKKILQIKKKYDKIFNFYVNLRKKIKYLRLFLRRSKAKKLNWFFFQILILYKQLQKKLYNLTLLKSNKSRSYKTVKFLKKRYIFDRIFIQKNKNQFKQHSFNVFDNHIERRKDKIPLIRRYKKLHLISKTQFLRNQNSIYNTKKFNLKKIRLYKWIFLYKQLKEFLKIKQYLFYINCFISYLNLLFLIKEQKKRINKIIPIMYITLEKERNENFLVTTNNIKLYNWKKIIENQLLNLIKIDRKKTLEKYLNEKNINDWSILLYDNLLKASFNNEGIGLYEFMMIQTIANISNFLTLKKNQEHTRIFNLMKNVRQYQKYFVEKHFFQRYCSRRFFKVKQLNVYKTKRKIKMTIPYLKKFLYYRTRKKKRRTKMINGFLKKHHWFVPAYLEMDYNTLSGIIIKQPENKDLIYSFDVNLKEIISFYRSRGL